MKVRFTWDGRPVPEERHVRIDFGASEGNLTIRVDSPFYADPPPDAAAGSVPGLWNYEVVEVFLLGAGERYLEIELGPRGHYWVLQLDGVRRVQRSDLRIEYTASLQGNRWTGVARVPTDLLPDDVSAVNAYAIHGEGLGREYLAAHPVPGSQPDFHRLECFRAWEPPAELRRFLRNG